MGRNHFQGSVGTEPGQQHLGRSCEYGAEPARKSSRNPSQSGRHPDHHVGGLEVQRLARDDRLVADEVAVGSSAHQGTEDVAVVCRTRRCRRRYDSPVRRGPGSPRSAAESRACRDRSAACRWSPADRGRNRTPGCEQQHPRIRDRVSTYSTARTLVRTGHFRHRDPTRVPNAVQHHHRGRWSMISYPLPVTGANSSMRQSAQPRGSLASSDAAPQRSADRIGVALADFGKKHTHISPLHRLTNTDLLR